MNGLGKPLSPLVDLFAIRVVTKELTKHFSGIVAGVDWFFYHAETLKPARVGGGDSVFELRLKPFDLLFGRQVFEIIKQGQDTAQLACDGDVTLNGHTEFVA